MRRTSIDAKRFRNESNTLFHMVQRGAELVVTIRGKPVAVVRPFTTADRKESLREFIRAVKRIGRMSQGLWPEGLSAVEAVRAERREL